MRIVETIEKVPGGMMLIPLLLGSVVKTFFPGFLEYGSFTTALFKNGALPLIALLIVATGAQISLRQSKAVLVKTSVLLLAKTIIPGFLIIIYGYIFGKAGILGFSLLAVLVAFINSNGGLWLALAARYGDSNDQGAYIASALNDGPFFTLLFLGLSGLGSIPWKYIVAAIIPFLVGFIWGNLDKKFAEMMKPTARITIPFFSFSLGAGIDLRSLFVGGFTGIIIGVAVTIITGTLGYLSYRYLLREKSAIGFAIGTTAGNSVATPAIVADADPSFKPFLAVATPQVAASVLVTAILVPIFTHYLDRRLRAS
ncbi:2-keto-3-deoxygluconate permease [Thermanaeromonas toyohensis ToBE]|uniref:2-keto-3-deoxygluconate permease n=1 Tax=Thermanaeromonas toyohensis ToBE TaxID=698762 RepID=A0A1W1W1G7_9FIRM|nr:2-keto-3-deoxygluconate permease [Thermanaeromonas toyohensis]SMB98944.1 2-keto-3-deoxygluconate permease [Thermanaeromonas toyohensis ToBE]